MKRIILLCTVAALLVAAMTIYTTAAFAASFSQTCSANGGTPTKQNGTFVCTYPPTTQTESAGSNPNGNNFSQETQTVTTKHGNNSNTETNPTGPCTNPQGNPTSSANCPA